MTSEWIVQVKHFDVDTSIETDISEDFISAPIFTDTGSGEVNNAKIVLDAVEGKYITQSPIIDRLDRIRLIVIDGSGGIYNKVFDVKRVIPSESGGEGTRLTLILAGIEHHLQLFNYSKTHFFEGSNEVVVDIGNVYNVNNGTKQPTLFGHDNTSDNQLPKSSFQTSIFDYGISEEKGYNRIGEVSDKQGSSVDAGGSLDFFEYFVEYDNTLYDRMTLKIKSAGSTGGITLTDDTDVNIGETEGGIDSITGTVINAWGANDQGSLPIEFSKFKSREQRFPFFPRWNSAETYQINSRVQDEGITYKGKTANNIGNTPASNPGDWTIETTASYYGNVIQYSPWTVDKAKLWQAAGCDYPSTTDHFGEGCWDGNLVIWDDQEGSFRTDVDTRKSNPSNISLALLYGNNQPNGYYRGLRILVETPAGILATDQFGTGSGRDRNNRSYTNAVVEYIGGEWRVKYPEQVDMQYCVIDEGVQYQNVAGTIIDVSGNNGQNDTWHPYDILDNQPGIITDASFTINNNSAIRVQYNWNWVTSILSGTGSTDELSYATGAWINFRFPYPHNDERSISENPGDLYGGGTQGITVKEPATLEQQNMNLTHDGLRGFNQGSSSEDYGPISALEFWTKLHYQSSALGFTYTTILEGNFNMRCFIYETSDNIIFQDYVIRFNNHWEPVKLPMSGFHVYRGRKPLANLVATIIPPKNLEAQNIFEDRNIKQIAICTKDSYDSEGRYNQIGTRWNNPILGGANADPFRRIDMYIDSWRFTKPLLANTGIDSVRNIEPDFLQRPDLGNYDQLFSDAQAELLKAKFEHVEFDVNSTGKFDIPFADHFFYSNPRTVNFSDNGANTVKLVNKGAEYSITKPEGGKGGFLRKMRGIRRFE